MPEGAQLLDAYADLKPVLPLNGGLQVVTRVDSSAPAADPNQAGNVNPEAMSSVAYQYAGARVQAGGRGFLGFQYLKTVDLQTQIKTTTHYRQDFPFTGAALRTATFAPDGKMMSEAENHWDFIRRSGADGTHYYQTLLQRVTETGYTLHTDGNTGALSVNPTPIKTVVTNNEYDAHGNLTRLQQSTTGSGAYAIRKDNVLSNRYGPGSITLDHWARALSYPELGRLSRAMVTTTLDGSNGGGNGETGENTRTTAFTYYQSGTQAGLLHTETIEPDGAQAITRRSTHHYDAFGNETQVTTRGWDGHAVVERQARSEYGPQGRYVDRQFNHYGQRLSAVLARDRHGRPQRTQDLAGIVTTLQYDDLGREIRRANDSSDEVITSTYHRCADVGHCPPGAQYVIEQHRASGGGNITYFDRLGRTQREGHSRFDGRWVYTDTEYDALSRPLRQSEPFSDSPQHWTRHHHDVLGRPWQVIAADGTQQQQDYRGLTVTITNHLGQSRRETQNALGQLVAVRDLLEDNRGGHIDYAYTLDGELSQLRSYHADGRIAATTVLEYDAWGRKIRMDDPDKGEWLYRYNAFGELIEQVDAKGQVVEHTYDALGRLIARSDYQDRAKTQVEGHTAWVFENDTGTNLQVDNGRGQLRTVIYSQGAQHSECQGTAAVQCLDYVYTEHGRLSDTLITLQIPDAQGTLQPQQYNTRITYDRFGRTHERYDALNDQLKLGGSGLSGTRTIYNAHGYPAQVLDLQTGEALNTINEHNDRGQILSETRGNGATTQYRYHPANGRLQHQHTGDALGLGPAIQEISYQWDDLGNLQTRHNQSAAWQGGQNNLQEHFCYDALNRLIKTQSHSNCENLSESEQDLRYNSLGNITYKRNIGQYHYLSDHNRADSAKEAGPHALTRAGKYRFEYDNQGNLVRDYQREPNCDFGDNSCKPWLLRRSLSYTTFDKPQKIQQGDHTTQFAYGHDRARYWRQDQDQHGVITTTVYLGGVERISRSDSNDIQWKRHLGHSIVTLHSDPSGTVLKRLQRYVYRDHLGSLDVITTRHGQVIQRLSFGPWGLRRNAHNWKNMWADKRRDFNSQESTRGFTDHEHLDALGLIHMNGRIYDPHLGRFVQADPHIQAPNDTQMLNRYSYVRNNPLNATDPSGFIIPVLVGFIASAVGAAPWAVAVAVGTATAAQAYVDGGDLGDALQAGVIAGLSAFAFAEIGEHYRQLSDTNIAADWGGPSGFGAFGGNALTAGQVSQQILAHGMTGGVTAALQGGKFGHGFLSAGLTKSVTGRFSYADDGATAVFTRTAIAAIVGGTISEVTGGKFSRGARTAAIAHIMNAESGPGDEDGDGIADAIDGDSYDNMVLDPFSETHPGRVVDEVGGGVGTKRVTISRDRYPESAKHIEDAVSLGKPNRLTIDRAGARTNRRNSLKGVKTKSGLDRDEFPPAMFREGGTGASVRHISPGDNRGAGSCIGAQCRGLPNGTRIKIDVVD